MRKASRAVASPRVVCIEDFRPLARRRLPKSVFDYLDGGAEGEVTLRENCRVFNDVTFRPRHAVAVPQCGLCTSVLGFNLSLPFLLAPVGYSRLMHPGGEVAAARAAGNAGTGYILSTISGHKLENVKAGSTGPVFYQLYLMGGRGAAEAAIERARIAGFSALVVTIDTPVAGIRERDYRNGMKELISGGLLAKIPYLPQILSRPAWLINYLLDGGLPGLPNVIVPGKGPLPLVDINAALAESAVTWADLRWIREVWRGPIIVKGVLTGDDARHAMDEGAAAVSVSNHGGRQLDGVQASLRALPEVVQAVNGRIEVWMDGGVRRGTDIIKALCLGARAVLCGRAYAYGLAAAGEAGVDRAIEILRVDLERTLRLLGCPSVAELDRSYINIPKSWDA
ncbi:MAG TPA: alpha-hydroxy acid oxidase [Candidatus Aquilonibacter sp.]|jgi:isopentenyl diphosphate isomerase/L-lactate dehydrogenase-like FMN-dependent dehydrogenase|nr:alpha-hydroxy acid oxidase [Candidatus Aquilonibacter sp.]